MTTRPFERRAETDKFGRYTGYDYWRCPECGVEAMCRDVVTTACDCVEW